MSSGVARDVLETLTDTIRSHIPPEITTTGLDVIFFKMVICTYYINRSFTVCYTTLITK
jgi:hypothetical protein